MKYRTKLRVGFLATSIAVNVLSLVVLYTLSHRHLLNEFRQKVLSITATTATLLDGDLHDRIRTAGDEAAPPYRTIQRQLQQVQERNRRDGTYVKYIYTLRLVPGTTGSLVYVVDPDEDPKEHAHVGDVFPYPGEKIWGERAYVEEEFFTDKTGSWLSGYAPIRNSQGQVAGMVEVDIAADRVRADLLPLVWAAVGSVAISLVLGLVVTFWLSGRVARPLQALQATLERIGGGDLTAHSPVEGNDEFSDVSRAINHMVDGLREREMVKSAFARYVSQQVMESIISAGAVPELQGHRRKITAFFSDIRGFSTIAEKMEPEAVVAMLNEYFKLMVDIVFRNQGTLDKFMGDGLMAIFGAPAEDPEQEAHAVRAAVEMQVELKRLCDRWQAEGRPPIRIGIGINTGAAIVGNIGSEARMEYTAIGDTVNIAARLESATKEYGRDILISEFTRDGVNGAFETEAIGSLAVKGRAEPVVTYAVSY